jgi:hypothetical protein
MKGYKRKVYKYTTVDGVKKWVLVRAIPTRNKK